MFSAAATASGRAGIALEQLDAAGAGFVLGHRPQPRPALADAAVVVPVDQVGGAEGGTAAESRGRRGRPRSASASAGACRRPSIAGRLPRASGRRGDVQTDGPVAVGANDLRHRAQRVERRAGGMTVGVVLADLDRGDERRRPLQQRREPGVGAAVMGDLERLDARQVERRGHVRLGIRREQQVERPVLHERDERVVVRVAARTPAGRARRRPQHAQAQLADPQRLPGAGRDARARRCARAPRAARAAPRSASRRRRRAPAAGGSAAMTGSAMPSWSLSACVRTSRSSRSMPASSSRRRIGPPGGPVSTSTEAEPRCSSVASPWPMSRNETTSSPGAGAATCRGRAATSAPRPRSRRRRRRARCHARGPRGPPTRAHASATRRCASASAGRRDGARIRRDRAPMSNSHASRRRPAIAAITTATSAA